MKYTASHQLTRRDAVRIGCLAPLGVSPGSLVTRGPNGTPREAPGARACILVWLDGGPSHLETFDLKPDAPAEVRGPFGAIDTVVEGMRICELLPQTAKVAGSLAIVRSLTSPLGEHGLANQYLLTGYKPTPVLQYPSYGAVLSHRRGIAAALPNYVAIPEARQAGAGFLGARHEPFSAAGDLTGAGPAVKDLEFYPDMDESRLLRRRAWLTEFDGLQRRVEGSGAGPATGLEQGFRLITTPDAKRAFDLSAESAEVRARYGPKMFGQSCLLARRLVERGVPFVTVVNTGWDTHENLHLQLKLGYTGARVGVGLLPTFDQGFSALIEDLSERGLLQDTLVVAMGEFGRTPKLNTRGGRDHWPRVFSAVLAGGGVRGGQVIGASDRVGESPVERPVTPADLARSIYTILGVDPDHELQTPDGRPVPVNQGGQLIPGLT
jgi:Protein of unknown function (DUF1501)